MTTQGWSAPRTYGRSREQARRRAAACLALGAGLSLAVAVASLDGGAAASVSPAPSPVAPTGVGDIDGLDPAVARSVRLAIDAAAAEGVELQVTSGWRSAERQAVLHAEAAQKYGSANKARQWVLPTEESEHVRGGAVDVGPPAAVTWLEQHGVRFGLCRRYANEPWHFERLAGAKGSVCPAMEPHP